MINKLNEEHLQDFDSMWIWKDGKILSELEPIEFELEIG